MALIIIIRGRAEALTLLGEDRPRPICWGIKVEFELKCYQDIITRQPGAGPANYH